MGREASCACNWNDEVSEVKALLESTEIILRGGLRQKFARADITHSEVEGGRLHIHLGPQRLILALGEAEAQKWLKALNKPLPSLAEKLGLSTSKLGFLIGPFSDALSAKLAETLSLSIETATILIAIIKTERDLASAFGVAQSHPNLALWCLYPKGNKAEINDQTIRTFMRSNGYVDSKSCSVDYELTATRYGMRR